MRSPNEFWLCLHELSRAYEAEGATPRERTDSILAQFLRMPPIAQREVLDGFWPLAQYLPDIYQRVLATHVRTEPSESPVTTSVDAG